MYLLYYQYIFLIFILQETYLRSGCLLCCLCLLAGKAAPSGLRGKHHINYLKTRQFYSDMKMQPSYIIESAKAGKEKHNDRESFNKAIRKENIICEDQLCYIKMDLLKQLRIGNEDKPKQGKRNPSRNSISHRRALINAMLRAKQRRQESKYVPEFNPTGW